jgi:hypothetical protein
MPEKESGVTRALAYLKNYIAPLVLCLVAVFGWLDKRSQDRQASLNKRFDEIKQEVRDIKGDVEKKPGGLESRVTYLEIKVQLIDQGLSGVEIQMPGVRRMRRMFDRQDSVPLFVPVPSPRDTNGR